MKIKSTKKLDQPLFIRSTKKVQLTPEGEILLRHVEPAMNLIKRGEAQIADSIAGGGQIRIGASDTICRYFLVPYLKRFHREFPNVHIKQGLTDAVGTGCAEIHLWYFSYPASESDVPEVVQVRDSGFVKKKRNHLLRI